MKPSSVPATPLQRLINLGFTRVGEWKLKSSQPDGTIVFEPCDKHIDGPNVLYAFVDGEELLYIGKSVNTLKKRLGGYQKPGRSQFTNKRSNQKIHGLLSQLKRVEIYALIDSGLLSYGGFNLNLAAGLEDSLIATLRPTWNLSGRSEDQEL